MLLPQNALWASRGGTGFSLCVYLGNMSASSTPAKAGATQLTQTFMFLITLVLALPLTAATISGTVDLRDSREPAVRKGRDFSGVVVSLEPANGFLKTANQRHAQMVQKNKSCNIKRMNT